MDQERRRGDLQIEINNLEVRMSNQRAECRRLETRRNNKGYDGTLSGHEIQRRMREEERVARGILDSLETDLQNRKSHLALLTKFMCAQAEYKNAVDELKNTRWNNNRTLKEERDAGTADHVLDRWRSDFDTEEGYLQVEMEAARTQWENSKVILEAFNARPR